jgi:hypothetical protein
MAAPTVVTPAEGERTEAEPVAVGSAATWWYDWVDHHRVAASALVGVIATQMGTYFGYVFPAIGLPTLPWPLYNGILAVPAEEFGTTGSFFAGNSLHFVNGIVSRSSTQCSPCRSCRSGTPTAATSPAASCTASC